MINEVDAVIEALKIALEEAKHAKDELFWDVRHANRWINRLPGAWFGRWRSLKLKAESTGHVERKIFIGHVRATLAYLEANREAIRAMRGWSWRKAKPASNTDPIDAEFKDISPERNLTGKSLRVLK
jgi:hypothetical protein